MIAAALALAALSFPYASPAEAGAQLRAPRSWVPAFAGDGAENGRRGRSVALQPGGMSPLDAERAFAADAQKLGQWTAFRKWAAPEATMFVPQPINAQSWLKDRKDPAKAIDWWPTASYVSCDGSLAVNTGGWQRPDGAVGYFSTVWQRQPDGGWKWIVDSGGTLSKSRKRSAATIRIARCPSPQAVEDVRITSMEHRTFGQGQSADHGSLAWLWSARDGGDRAFSVWLWDGKRQRLVIDDKIAAPK